VTVDVLALDIGSSSVRAQRFGENGEPTGELRRARYETNDAAEVARLVRGVLGGEEPGGTSCFGHSLVALDARGRPLTPILGWRDTRSAEVADRLGRRLDRDAVHARTGAYLHPSFWPAKLAWLADAEPETFRAARRFVSFAEYVRGGATTSVSMASTTGMLDLTTSEWDAEVLDVLALEPERLPRIADEPVWLDGGCANVGADCVGPGRAALTAGTSGALRIVREVERPQPRPGLFCYRLDERRVVEGGAISDGGNLLAWLAATLREVDGPLAERDPGAHGLTFLSLLGGERSTGWDPLATGAVAGLTFATTPRDLRQAALEGVAYRFAEIADLLPDLDRIVATGGALLANPDWMQIMADVLERPVVASGEPEASLRGAAVLALERLGHIAAPAPTGRVFEPREERAEAYRSGRDRQRALYEATRGFQQERP
jgi:gluconokinase